MASILGQIQQSVDDQDFEKMKYLLSHIRQRHDIYTYLQCNTDFAEVLESFLFSIPNENSAQNDQQEILRLFLDIVNPSLIIPSLAPRYDTIAPVHHSHQVDLTIFHNLCIEGRHEALRILLNQIKPRIASYEVRRPARICVDYMDNMANIHHSDNYHTPMHATWNGTLFESVIEEDLAKVYHPSDLNKEWGDVWKTSVFLLWAFDKLSFDLSPSDWTYWNILHAIIRYGHGAHTALMWSGLKMYPHLARVFDHEGNLALHLSAKKQQIFYRFRKSHVTTSSRQSHNTHKDNGCMHLCPKDKYVASQMDIDSDIDIDSDRGKFADVAESDKSPISMLVASYPFAASVFDKDGRLPLHLILIHHDKNKALLDSTDEISPDEFDDHRPNGEYQMDTLNVMKTIVKANPRALECIEVSSGLYPFMLAASSKSMSTVITYALLSENPTVLEACLLAKKEHGGY